MKKCKECKEEVPSTKWSYKDNICSRCSYWKTRPKARAKYIDKCKIRKLVKAYRDSGEDKIKELEEIYHKDNEDGIIKRSRSYYEGNIEKERRMRRRYTKTNKKKRLLEDIGKNKNRFQKLNYPTSQEDFKEKIYENLENAKRNMSLTIPLKLLRSGMKKDFEGLLDSNTYNFSNNKDRLPKRIKQLSNAWDKVNIKKKIEPKTEEKYSVQEIATKSEPRIFDGERTYTTEEALELILTKIKRHLGGA